MPSKKSAVRRRGPVQFTESDFEVRDSSIPNIGQGLFALRMMRPGDTIGFYLGKIINDKMSEQEPYISSRYLVYVCQDHWIEGQIDGNYTRFINHSNKPNAELVTSVRWKTARIKALKLIRPGDEVFFDYGEDYWDALEDELKPVEK